MKGRYKIPTKCPIQHQYPCSNHSESDMTRRLCGILKKWVYKIIDKLSQIQGCLQRAPGRLPSFVGRGDLPKRVGQVATGELKNICSYYSYFCIFQITIDTKVDNWI